MPTPNIAESLEEAISGAHAPPATPAVETSRPVAIVAPSSSNGNHATAAAEVAELRSAGAVTPAQQRLSRPMEAIDIPHRKVSKICCIGAGYVGMFCPLVVVMVARFLASVMPEVWRKELYLDGGPCAATVHHEETTWDKLGS